MARAEESDDADNGDGAVSDQEKDNQIDRFQREPTSTRQGEAKTGTSALTRAQRDGGLGSVGISSSNETGGYVASATGPLSSFRSHGPTPIEKLNAMTPKERLLGLHDLHCVSAVIEEDPQFIARKIETLDKTLRSRRIHPTPSNTIINALAPTTPSPFQAAYGQAREQYRDYFAIISLRFLRAERFDTDKALTRIARYFEVKRSYFGGEAMGRDLKIEDFNDNDRQFFRTGFIQVLSERDPKGRCVIFIVGPLCSKTPLKITVSDIRKDSAQ